MDLLTVAQRPIHQPQTKHNHKSPLPDSCQYKRSMLNSTLNTWILLKKYLCYVYNICTTTLPRHVHQTISTSTSRILPRRIKYFFSGAGGSLWRYVSIALHADTCTKGSCTIRAPHFYQFQYQWAVPHFYVSPWLSLLIGPSTVLLSTILPTRLSFQSASSKADPKPRVEG